MPIPASPGLSRPAPHGHPPARERRAASSSPAAAYLLTWDIAAASSRDARLSSVLAAATLKLRAALPASLRENASRLSERFYLDAPGWYRRPADVPHLLAVASAVWEHQVIQVTYQ